jgi:hypothetical protein
MSSPDDTEETASDFGMPERKGFEAYYDSVVSKGAEMNKKQFLAYENVVSLVDKGLVYEDDLDDLWLSATGDASGLNQEEAYELLCMVHDLPDPEDQKFFDEEFEKLSEGKGVLGYKTFVEWSDVQDMLDAEVLSADDIAEVWKEVVGDMNAKITRDTFGKLNKALDESIDEMQNEDFEIETDEAIFTELSKGRDVLTYKEFSKWDDIEFLIDTAVLSKDDLDQIWRDVAGDLDAEVSLAVFSDLNTALDEFLDALEEGLDEDVDAD